MIEKNYVQDVDMCKVKMFAEWHRGDSNPTYEKLVRALVAVGKTKLAKSVCKTQGISPSVLDATDAIQSHAKPYQMHGNGSSSSSESGVGTSLSEGEPIHGPDFSLRHRCGCNECSIYTMCDVGCPKPDKDVVPVSSETTSAETSVHHFHLEAQRQHETKEVMTAFASLVGKTCKSIKKKVTLEEFTLWLKQLQALSPCSESTPGLLAQQIDEISQAGSMEQVFHILSDYWSWYNYYLLEKIINEYGDEKDRQRLDSFKKDFSIFAQNRIVEFAQYPMTFGTAADDGKTRVPLLFKVDRSWDSVHINQLTEIHRNLASILGVNPHTLYLASIQKGCILMKFLIPSLVARAVFPLSASQKESLAATNITLVECGSHCHRFLSHFIPQENVADSSLPNDAVTRNWSDVTSPESALDSLQMAALGENTLHMTEMICNALWGHHLGFCDFTSGDRCVEFSKLWPDKETLVETYYNANLERASYELCKLLLATKSVSSIRALLAEKVLLVNHNFCNGGVTLAHLACALGCREAVQLLREYSVGSSPWIAKDDEDRIPIQVCFSQELRNCLPNSPFFIKKILTGQPLKSVDRDRIFQLATRTDHFYKFVVQLQIYQFDVNKDRNKEGDLLIHVAVRGGLPFLPNLFVLVDQFKADITLQDKDGLTPLCLAAMLGHEKVAEVLVCVFGADVNAAEQDRKWTPLHFAVDSKHPKMVSMLLRRGADVQREDEEKCVPELLARRNRASECQHIITKHVRERTELLGKQAADGSLKVSKLYPSDACLVTAKGQTLLILATKNNWVELVRELVKMPNCPLDFKEMQYCNTLDTMESTITSTLANAAPQHYPEEVYSLKTAVHYAAENGFTTCLQLLLDAEAHPTLPDGNCWLPLHYACDLGHIDCVKAILAYPNYLGLSGLSGAIHLAEGNENEEILDLLKEAFERRQRELVKPVLFDVAHSGNTVLLFQTLENGDNVNPIDQNDDWPLLLAAGFGYIDVVEQLFEFGGHVTHKHRISQSTPLHVAARGGHTPVVRYLLQFYCHISPSPSLSPTLPTSSANAARPTPKSGEVDKKVLDLNERNVAGATPLELAATQGHLEVVRLLLDHGASTTLPDSNGCLISCPGFAGTQFIIETNRKERLRRIVAALKSLKQLQKIWQDPSDFNLRCDDGDTILMVAAKHSSPDILQFLLQSAATLKPGMLVSPSGQPLQLDAMSGLQNSVFMCGFPSCKIHSSSSDETYHSDCFLPDLTSPAHSVPHSDILSLLIPSNTPDRLRTFSTNPFDSDNSDSDVRPASVMPVANPTRKKANTHSASYRKPRSSKPWLEGVVSSDAHSSTTATSFEEEKMATKLSGMVEVDEDTEVDTTGPQISIIRLKNPHDGQTALHRAADFNQLENVSILVKMDPEWANIKDKNGNTPLHLACRKAHKKTIKAMLSLDAVDCSVRNSLMELPEEGCLKSGLRRAVCKHRQLQEKAEAENKIRMEFPSPPVIPKNRKIGVSASVGAVNNVEPYLPDSLPELETTPNLLMSYLNGELERLKLESEEKKDGSNS